MRILVNGGGIGGLATAIGLRKSGHEALIFEQAPLPREVAAGVSLCLNALQAADHLGLGDAYAGRQYLKDRAGFAHGMGDAVKRSGR